jgi:hypothetical protein
MGAYTEEPMALGFISQSGHKSAHRGALYEVQVDCSGRIHGGEYCLFSWRSTKQISPIVEFGIPHRIFAGSSLGSGVGNRHLLLQKSIDDTIPDVYRNRMLFVLLFKH